MAYFLLQPWSGHDAQAPASLCPRHFLLGLCDSVARGSGTLAAPPQGPSTGPTSEPGLSRDQSSVFLRNNTSFTPPPPPDPLPPTSRRTFCLLLGFCWFCPRVTFHQAFIRLDEITFNEGPMHFELKSFFINTKYYSKLEVWGCAIWPSGNNNYEDNYALCLLQCLPPKGLWSLL